MTEAIFHRIHEYLHRYIQTATCSLQVAVCWFTRKDLFDALMARLEAGVEVAIVLEYDDRNICPDGLDFSLFIQKGGKLFAYCQPGLMHHKFVLIDNKSLLTGSYNWTYNNNAENLICSNDPVLCEAYTQAFLGLLVHSREIRSIKPEEVRRFSIYPLFESARFDLVDLRKKVSAGSNLWVLKTKSAHKTPVEDCLEKGLLPFDAGGVLSDYWLRYPNWDKRTAADFLSALKINPKLLLQRWIKGVQHSDLIAVVNTEGILSRLGIVQSDPQAFNGNSLWSSFREVQWLNICGHVKLHIPKQAAALFRYKGSVLELLQRCYKVQPPYSTVSERITPQRSNNSIRSSSAANAMKIPK